MGGKDAHPTTNLMFCGTGILPVSIVSRCADFVGVEAISIAD